MPVNAEDWLGSLPAVLSPQRAVIARLLEHARTDERVRLFVVGCSIGRGAADRLSDVDALVGVQERTFDDMARSSAELVRAGGEVLDIFQQIIPPTSPDGRRSQHTYAHYIDGVELDLALAIVRESQQPRPDWVVLYDPDETVRGELLSKAASADDVRAWGCSSVLGQITGACGPQRRQSPILCMALPPCWTIRGRRCRQTSRRPLPFLTHRP